MGKQRTLIFLALLIVACSGFVLLFVASRGPIYQGKTLTTWLDLYRSNHGSNRHELDQQAESAIRHFGTNEIPRYLKMLFRRQSAIRIKLLSSIPQAWTKRLHISPKMDYDAKLWSVRASGAYGLIALGPEAKTAIPALIARLNDKQEEADIRNFAILTIYWLGPVARDALPSVIRGLNDQDPAIRTKSILALGSIHDDAEEVIPRLVDLIDKNFTNPQYDLVYFALDSVGKFKTKAASAVPAIVRCLDHPETSVRGNAILALSEIHAHPELAVPALIEHLETTKTKTLDEKRMIYTYTFSALGRFGPEARSAVPTLLRSVNDADLDIRGNARGALKDIDPEAAAKAELK